MLRQFQAYTECSRPPLHDGKADYEEAMASWWSEGPVCWSCQGESLAELPGSRKAEAGTLLQAGGLCQHPSRPLQARATSQCPTTQATLPSPL